MSVCSSQHGKGGLGALVRTVLDLSLVPSLWGSLQDPHSGSFFLDEGQTHHMLGPE